MSLASNSSRIVYLGDGTSASFAFQREFHALSDLKVFIWNSARPVFTLAQAFTTDYTVSGQADAQNRYTNGGIVIFNSTPAVGDHITIVNDPDFTQPFNLNFNQTIPSADLVKALDRISILEKRLQDLTKRSIRLPDSFPLAFDASMPDELPAGSPIVVSSSGVGISIGVVSSNSTVSTSFFGILPVDNGGTGLDFSTTQGLIYSPGNNSTFVQLPLAQDGFPLIAKGSSSPVFQALSLQGSSVVGILPQANGGTGTASSFPQYGLLFQEDTQSVGFVPSGINGTVLTAHGSSAPTFDAFSAVNINSGILIAAHGGTGTGSNFTQYGVFYGSSVTQASQTPAPGIDQILIGNPLGIPAFGAVNLQSNSSVTGILPQLYGGTGTASSFALFSVLFQQGALSLGAAIPAGAGTVLTANASSAPTFQAANITPVAPTQISANQVLTNADRTVLASSSLYTITLYDANGNEGRTVDIKRMTQALGKTITIAGSAAQISTTIDTLGETISLIARTGAWELMRRTIPSVYETWSPTTPGLGSSVFTCAKWRRSGPNMEFMIRGATGTATANLASMTMPPGSVIANSSIMGNSSVIIGYGVVGANSAARQVLLGIHGQSSFIFALQDGTNPGLIQANGNGIFGNGTPYSYNGTVPIAGWNGGY